MQSPAYIVLARAPGENRLHGLTEYSFGMAWSDSTVRLWWSGEYQSILGNHVVDGRADAEEQCSKLAQRYPGWSVTIYDASHDDCPVMIDWQRWEDAVQRRSRCKFEKRNARFEMRQ